MALSGINLAAAKMAQSKSRTAYRLRKLTERLKQLNQQSFAAHLVRNEISRLNGTAENLPSPRIRQYAEFLQDKAKQYADKPGVRWLIQKELKQISQNRFTGRVAFPTIGAIDGIGKAGRGRKKVKRFFKKVGTAVKKVTRGLKTVALAPARNAFLGLVKLNLRGLASKMKRANQSKITKLWERLGGKKSSILKAISTGARKKALLGGKGGAGTRKKRIRGFNDSIGVLDLFNQPIGLQPTEGEGAAAAAGAAAAGAAALANPATGGTAAGIIAAAAPVLIAFTKLLKSEGLDTAEGQMDLDTGEITQEGTGSVLDNIMGVAGSVAQSLGLSPSLPSNDYQVSDVEEGANQAAGQPTDDSEVEDAAKTTAFPALPIIAIAGIGLLFLLRKK